MLLLKGDTRRDEKGGKESEGGGYEVAVAGCRQCGRPTGRISSFISAISAAAAAVAAAVAAAAAAGEGLFHRPLEH
jgi:hypothetical protein